MIKIKQRRIILNIIGIKWKKVYQKNVTPNKPPKSSNMTYVENDELRHDLLKLIENFDEWSGSKIKKHQLLNQKSDMENE